MATNFPRESDFSLDFSNIPSQIGGRAKWGFLILGLILAFLLLSLLRSVYTDWLWFGEIGFRGVYVKILVTRIVLLVGGAVVFAIPLGISIFFAGRLSSGPEEIPLPQGARGFLKALIRWGTVAAIVVLSLILGTIVAGQWEILLKFWNATTFGIDDPVYNRDVSFYVFSLPVLGFLQGWLLGSAIVVLLATLALYFVNYSFRGVGLLLTPGLKVHVSIIAAAVMFVIAFGHWLDRWELVLSSQGAVFGAAYTDLNANQPALLIMTIVAGAAGTLMLVNAYLKGVRLLVGAVVLWVAMAVLLGVIWPNFVQQFRVNPNEFARESPYIDRNIEFTRQAFGLGDMVESLYPADPVLTAELVSQNTKTIDNIRLWDHQPLADVYRQIQLIRPYYDFKDADVDRYFIDGEYRQVMLAAREVAPEKLDSEAQTWVNTKLRYTHGFGLAMSPVTEFTAEGRPEFFAKDIPQDGVIRVSSTSPDSAPDVVVENPRIYYGEKTVDYVIVNTKTDELDYQAEGGELRSVKYFGEGGVPLSSFFRRLFYAWQFGDINILISGEISGESRIQYRREIQERISAVVPFLRLDQDPYLVASDTQLFWVQDAYTVSDRYPYSDPHADGFNYVRNSVKVTVDAFNGTPRFYVADPTDPLIETYQDIFPNLFLALDDMPPDLRAHIRYPQDLFQFQAGKYLKYHMLDSQDFYNLEDIWTIPDEKFGQGGTLQPVAPYYVIMKLPGEEEEEFVLLIPYARNDPPIMAGWLAARSDGDNYGKLIGLLFPKERQLDSPRQIEAKIDNDTTISPELTLLCQEGSECIRGNLLVIPMAHEDTFSLLYAEPIYLKPEGVDFPELKKVILASQERVVMRDTIPEAIAALTGFSRPATPDRTDGAASPAPPDLVSDTVQAAIEAISEVIEDLRQGLVGLEDALRELQAAIGDP